MASAAEQLASSINFGALAKATELKQRIWYTLGLLIVARVGAYIPLPGIDSAAFQAIFAQHSGGVLGMVDMFAGGAISRMTVFALGIMPYISASIIFQLLASVVPSLEALMKEGESGRKKINEYTRYATVFLCMGQSAMWVRYMMGTMQVVPPEFQTFWHGMVSVLIMTAGTVFLMWIGEQIDEYGIGNGISLLIMAGILARMPYAIWSLLSTSTLGLTDQAGKHGLVSLICLAILFVAVIIGVIAMTESQRRIPTQSAKHVRGRRVYGGARQYLPLKVNQAGVMPIIFASSLLMFPYFLLASLDSATAGWANSGGFLRFLHGAFQEGASAFRSHGYVYTLAYILLIYFFCYFWTAITFNPKDMADNLKDYGSFIPGYRPGRRTADYLEKVMLRITYVGAAFLALVAIIPSLVQAQFNIDFAVASFLGGTGLLIVVSVCLDLVQKIDSHLIMRNYTGILSKK